MALRVVGKTSRHAVAGQSFHPFMRGGQKGWGLKDRLAGVKNSVARRLDMTKDTEYGDRGYSDGEYSDSGYSDDG